MGTAEVQEYDTEHLSVRRACLAPGVENVHALTSIQADEEGRLFVGTTTPSELRLALEWLRVPYRYAFSVSLAFQSVGLLDDEWRAIYEAQRARGAGLARAARETPGRRPRLGRQEGEAVS